jgi:hypothetical protein
MNIYELKRVLNVKPGQHEVVATVGGKPLPFSSYCGQNWRRFDYGQPSRYTTALAHSILYYELREDYGVAKAEELADVMCALFVADVLCILPSANSEAMTGKSAAICLSGSIIRSWAKMRFEDIQW